MQFNMEQRKRKSDKNEETNYRFYREHAIRYSTQNQIKKNFNSGKAIGSGERGLKV